MVAAMPDAVDGVFMTSTDVMSRRCPCPPSGEVDMTDKFAPPSGPATCEVRRLQACCSSPRDAGKFRGLAQRPECGASKSKFKIDEAPSAQARPQS